MQEIYYHKGRESSEKTIQENSIRNSGIKGVKFRPNTRGKLLGSSDFQREVVAAPLLETVYLASFKNLKMYCWKYMAVRV